jgi:predicted deacetylase
MKGTLCVAVHDVADKTWPLCRRLIEEIEAVAAVPLTLLAVPRFHGERASTALEGWLGDRVHQGDELALHGFTHADDRPTDGLSDWLLRRVYTRSEGEFLHLDVFEARERLCEGIDWFGRNGWPLAGFVAPAWLLGPQAWRAVLGMPVFHYTATLRYVHLLDDRRRVRSQSLVYSTDSAWRRTASRAWVAVNARAQGEAELLRLELHPGDVQDAAVRRSWQRVLEGAAEQRQAMTMAAYVKQCGRARLQ